MSGKIFLFILKAYMMVYIIVKRGPKSPSRIGLKITPQNFAKNNYAFGKKKMLIVTERVKP